MQTASLASLAPVRFRSILAPLTRGVLAAESAFVAALCHHLPLLAAVSRPSLSASSARGDAAPANVPPCAVRLRLLNSGGGNCSLAALALAFESAGKTDTSAAPRVDERRLVSSGGFSAGLGSLRLGILKPVERESKDAKSSSITLRGEALWKTRPEERRRNLSGRRRTPRGARESARQRSREFANFHEAPLQGAIASETVASHRGAAKLH